MTGGPAPDRRSRAPSLARTLVIGALLAPAAAAAALASIGFGLLVSSVDVEPTMLATILGLAAGGLLGLLAITRFSAFLAVLLVIRSSLDSFKISDVGSSAITEPSVIVGAVLLLGCGLWLVAQLASGQFHRPSRTALWLSAFGILAVVSAGGSAGPVMSLLAGLRVLTGAMTFLTLEQLFAARPDRIRPFLLASGLSLAIPAVVAIDQILHSDEVYAFTDVVRVSGTFVHPNALAAYLVIVTVGALAVAPALEPAWRSLANAVAALGAGLTIFTYARGAWIALALGCLYVVIRFHRRLLPLVVVAGLAVVLLLPSVRGRFADLESSPAPQEVGDGTANSLEWRVGYWQRILPLGLENPVTGLGLDQVPNRTPDRAQPHNGFVQAFVETGTLGLLALLGLVVAATRDIREGLRRRWTGLDRHLVVAAAAVSFGLLLQMFTENLLTQVVIHIYLWVPVAYVCARLGQDRELDRGQELDPAPLPALT